MTRRDLDGWVVALVRARDGAIDRVRKRPFWPTVERIAAAVARPAQRLGAATIRRFPVVRQAEWLLEIERLVARHPVPVALALVYALWRGLLTTPLGHIATDPTIYPVVGALSSFNPFLGMVSGAVFGAGDIAQKLLINDIFRAESGGLDYWGSIVGYIIAYSALMTMGVLPGVMSRVFRRLARSVFRPAAPPAAMAEGAGPAAPPVISLGELVASFFGAGIGGYVAMAEIAPIAETPAFYLRPNPDVSCYNSEVHNYLKGRAPVGGAGAATGVLVGDLTDAPPKPPSEEPRLTVESAESLLGPKRTVNLPLGEPPADGNTPGSTR